MSISSKLQADVCLVFFFFNDPATTEIYTLSLHDALPICGNFALLGFKFRFSDADGIGGHLRPQPPLAGTWEALADHEHVHGGVVIPGLRHRYLPAAIHDRRIIKHASSRYVCLCHRHLSRADANLGIGLQRDLLGLLQADRCHSRIWMRVLRQHIERSLVWIVSRDSQRSSQPEK